MAGTTKNLFLQIGGSADGLTTAAKAARSSLAQVGADFSNMEKVVAESFQKLAGSDIQQSTRQIESSIRKTLSNIRAAAQDTMSQPLTAAGITNISVANS